MFAYSDTAVAASTFSVASATSVVLPLTLSASAGEPQAALKVLREAVTALQRHPSNNEADVQFILCVDRLWDQESTARVQITPLGKDVLVLLTIAIAVRLPDGADIWSRLDFICARRAMLADCAQAITREAKLDIVLEKVVLQ